MRQALDEIQIQLILCGIKPLFRHFMCHSGGEVLSAHIIYRRAEISGASEERAQCARGLSK